MKKVIFQDGVTKANAELFNTMQNNIEEEFNKTGELYTAKGEQADIPYNTYAQLFSITLPAGKYVGRLWARNQGGGNTPFLTKTYFNTALGDADAANVSIDWSIHSNPIVIFSNEETTYTCWVNHTSAQSHKIDCEVRLLKIK